MAERLNRSRRERMIGGVAGGMAEYLRIDPTLVRIGWIALGLLTQGAAILLYILLLFVVPEEEQGEPGTATEPAPVVTTTRPGAGRVQGRTAGLVVGASLVLVGVWFLVRQFLPIFDWALSWPVIAIVGGVILLVAALRPKAGTGPGGRSG